MPFPGLENKFDLDNEDVEPEHEFEWKIPNAKFGYNQDSKFLLRQIQTQEKSFHTMRGKIMHYFDLAKEMDVTDFENIWNYFNLDFDDVESEPIGKALRAMGFTDENMAEIQDAANQSKIKYFILDFNRQNTDFNSTNLDLVMTSYNDDTVIQNANGVCTTIGTTGALSIKTADMINKLYGTKIDGVWTIPCNLNVTRNSLKNKINQELGPTELGLVNPNTKMQAILDCFNETLMVTTVPGLTVSNGRAIDLSKRGFSKLTIQEWTNTFIGLLDIRFKQKTSWWKRLLSIVLIIIAIVIFVSEVITGFSDGGQGSAQLFMAAVNILSSGYTVFSMLSKYFEKPVIEDDTDTETEDQPLDRVTGAENYNGLYEWQRPDEYMVLSSRPEYENNKPDAILKKGDIYAY